MYDAKDETLPAVTVALDSFDPPGSKFRLVKVGNRWVTSDGRWHDNLMAAYLLRKYAANPDAWTEVGELTLAFGHNSDANRRKVRARLASLQAYLLDTNKYVLVTEDATKPGSKIKIRWRVKIYNHNSMIERMTIDRWLNKMAATAELQGEKLAKARDIVASQNTY
jgi:hypothetical protein